MPALVTRQPLKVTAPVISVVASGANSAIISITTPAKEPTAGIRGYQVYRAASPTGPWGMPLVALLTPAQFPYTDSTLAGGQTASYQLIAVSAGPQCELSAPSNVQTVMTTTGTVPAPVSALSGVGVSSSAIQWSWPAALGATSYTLTVQGFAPVTGISGTSVTTSGLPPSTPENATVFGINGFGAGGSSPVATASTQPATSSLSTDPMPRSFLLIQGAQSHYADAAVISKAALFNIVERSGYGGIEPIGGSGSATLASVMGSTISQAAANGILSRQGIYVLSQAQSGVGQGAGGSTYVNWSQQIQNANWWLRNAWPAGSIVADNIGSNGQTCNDSAYNTVLDSGGRTFFQALARYFVGIYVQGIARSTFGEAWNIVPNSNLGIMFLDNQLWTPRTSGDWNRNGSIDPASNALSSALQQGHAQLAAAIRAIWNGLLIANCDFFNNWNPGQSTPFIDSSNVGLWDGVFCELAIGAGTTSKETFDPGNFMASLIASEAMIRAGGSLIVNQVGRTGGAAWSSTNQSSWSASDWQALRAGAALSGQRNYHWAPITPAYSALQIILADELQPAGMPVGWAGVPSSVETGPRTQGVWWHDTPNGRIYWNPRSNGAQTITVTGASFHRIPHNGYGDPSVNNGASVPMGTTITLQDNGMGDGLFLMKP